MHPSVRTSRVCRNPKSDTTEKEFLTVVFACDKFRPYIVDSKVTIHTDHAAIKYFMEKKDAKPRLITLQNKDTSVTFWAERIFFLSYI